MSTKSGGAYLSLKKLAEALGQQGLQNPGVPMQIVQILIPELDAVTGT